MIYNKQLSERLLFGIAASCLLDVEAPQKAAQTATTNYRIGAHGRPAGYEPKRSILCLADSVALTPAKSLKNDA